jgi:hypothetical protein
MHVGVIHNSLIKLPERYSVGALCNHWHPRTVTDQETETVLSLHHLELNKQLVKLGTGSATLIVN